MWRFSYTPFELVRQRSDATREAWVERIWETAHGLAELLIVLDDGQPASARLTHEDLECDGLAVGQIVLVRAL